MLSKINIQIRKEKNEQENGGITQFFAPPEAPNGTPKK